MGNFNRDRGGRGGGGFGGNRGGFRGDRDRSMHKAVCSNCGKDCEVPFKPSGDKPVYCNECFGKTSIGAGREPRREFSDRPQPRPSFDGGNRGGDEVKKQLEAINAKLDKLTQAIENLPQPKKVVAKSVAKVATKKVAKKAITKKGKK